MIPPRAAAGRAAAAIRGFLLEPAQNEHGADPGERVSGAGATGPVPAPELPVILTAAIGSSGGAASLAAAVGVAAAGSADGRCALLVDLEPPPRPLGPSVLASESARALEERIRALGGAFGAAAARGHLCYLPLSDADDPLRPLVVLLENALRASAVIVHLPAALWAGAIADPRLGRRS